jgi:hypothetical protein
LTKTQEINEVEKLINFQDYPIPRHIPLHGFKRSLYPLVPHGSGRLFRHSVERAFGHRTAKDPLTLHSRASFAIPTA